MPVVDIIARFKVQMGDFNKVMGMTLDQMKKMNKANVTIMSSGGRLANRFRNMTHGMRGFRMEMLGVMFFGMGMDKFFSGLLKPTLDLVGAFDVMNTTLAIGLLPTGIALLTNVFLPFQDWFLSQGPLVQELIGTFIVFGAIIGKITFLVGMFALGLGSLALVLGGMFLPLLIWAGMIILIAGLIVGLIFLWKNWEKISLKVKIALFAVSVVLGGLLIFFGLTVGWVFLVVAAIIALMAIIKNWGKITDWLKEKWMALKTWFKTTKFGQVVVAIVDKIKSAWKSFFDWIKEKWEKVKSIVSKVTAPVGRFIGGVREKITGSRQFGGTIPTDGLFRLHAGETVLPANQSLTFAPEINVNTTGGVDINRIKMELNDLWAKNLADLARR